MRKNEKKTPVEKRLALNTAAIITCAVLFIACVAALILNIAL